jgi:plastocyanin
VRPARALAPNQIGIDNFAFAPTPLTVAAGTAVTWINRDDVPHIIVDVRGRFTSRVLDTNQQYVHQFSDTGTYDYFCSIHPHMTGRVVVN